ncbi:hypothetical protein [Wohlfahrtiimonas populi]|uniref:hypothetical protein n=1 Tax=Wohlfahrtiimonas populi TaxID=1940240 RepID=UPI00098D0D82|nr:hypothetical protein [Wohlfahrtiimonas populi]
MISNSVKVSLDKSSSLLGLICMIWILARSMILAVQIISISVMRCINSFCKLYEDDHWNEGHGSYEKPMFSLLLATMMNLYLCEGYAKEKSSFLICTDEYSDEISISDPIELYYKFYDFDDRIIANYIIRYMSFVVMPTLRKSINEMYIEEN